MELKISRRVFIRFVVAGGLFGFIFGRIRDRLKVEPAKKAMFWRKI